MEVTKWLSLRYSGPRIGGRASVQAVTRVNAEQTSKRTMCRPTRQPFRGRLIWLGETSEEYVQALHRGSGGVGSGPSLRSDQCAASHFQVGLAIVIHR